MDGAVGRVGPGPERVNWEEGVHFPHHPPTTWHRPIPPPPNNISTQRTTSRLPDQPTNQPLTI